MNSLTSVFLTESNIWEGNFTNFVNLKGGIIQEGKIRVKVSVDDNGSIYHENAIFDKDGKPSPYIGSLKIRIEGNRIVNLFKIEKDEQTGTIIKNHTLNGFVSYNHIHFIETYDDVYPNKKIEHRRNSVHYYFLTKHELIMIADIYINNKLLVFANTNLKLMSG